MADTSPAQDIAALSDALVAMVKTERYQHMSFREFERSFIAALHAIRVEFLTRGTIRAEINPSLERTTP